MKNENYKSIKSFADACEALGFTEQDFNNKYPENTLSTYLLNTAKLEIINKAIVGSWVPDWTNPKEYKYYYWFNMKDLSSGVGFSDSNCGCAYSCSDVGSRLCYESREQVEYAVSQFEEVYRAVYCIPEKEVSLKELYTSSSSNDNFIPKNEKVKDFDYKTIKTYADACYKLGVSDKEPTLTNVLPEFRKAAVAAYKLMVVFKAINNGWEPNWGDSNEYKYYPWKQLKGASSGVSFSDSYSYYSGSLSIVGSRLCTYSSEVSNYIAMQFESLYIDWFLIEPMVNENIVTVTVSELGSIHKIACNDWKTIIKEYLDKYKDSNPFCDKVYLPLEEVDKMYKDATDSQKSFLDRVFKK
jgi:hypothetical protein